MLLDCKIGFSWPANPRSHGHRDTPQGGLIDLAQCGMDGWRPQVSLNSECVLSIGVVHPCERLTCRAVNAR